MPVIRLLPLLFAIGCSPGTVQLPEPATPQWVPILGSGFRPAECGTITGQVMDNGRPIPHAFVWLKSVDLNRSKPWPESFRSVRLISTDRGFEFASDRMCIRLGNEIEFESRRNKPNVIRGRGAMSFAIPLPGNGAISKRTTTQHGRIDFTSGSIMPNSHAIVMVCEHPYFATTDSNGRYELTEIPAGQYELLAWAFNDTVASYNRDPESGLISRHQFEKPFESTDHVTVYAGQTMDWVLSVTLPR